MIKNNKIRFSSYVFVAMLYSVSPINFGHSVDYSIINQSRCEIIKNINASYKNDDVIKSPEIIKTKGYIITKPTALSNEPYYLIYDILCGGDMTQIAAIGGYIDFTFEPHNNIFSVYVDIDDRNELHVIIETPQPGMIIVRDSKE